MRRSSGLTLAIHTATVLTALIGVTGAGCSPHVLVVVGEDRCADASVTAPPKGCRDVGLLDDLVGYWRLDDGRGQMAYDSSERGNHGTLVGTEPTAAWVEGRLGGGLMTGMGFVRVQPSASLDSITEQVTLAGWGYLDGPIAAQSYATIASRQLGTTIDQHYHIAISTKDEPITFLKTDAVNTSIYVTSTLIIPRRTWVHIAATYDGTTARLYLDGLEVGKKALTGRLQPDTTPVLLGANGNGAAGTPTELFPGRIDDVRLYRRALTAGEISALSGATSSGTPPVRDAGVLD